MASRNRSLCASHPVLRRLLLLVPLTWPGIAYGLWQRRRTLWLFVPRPPVGAWAHRVATSTAFRSSLIAIGLVALASVGAYGTVMYGVPMLISFLQPSTPMLQDPGGAIAFNEFDRMGSTIAGYVGPMLSVMGLLTGGVMMGVGNFTRGAAMIGISIGIGVLLKSVLAISGMP